MDSRAVYRHLQPEMPSLRILILTRRRENLDQLKALTFGPRSAVFAQRFHKRPGEKPTRRAFSSNRGEGC